MLGEADYLALKSKLSFSQFSMQWLSLLLCYPLMKVVSLKNLTLLIQIAKYGSASIFVYAIYITAQFFVAWSNDEIVLDNLTWFSWSSLAQAGTFTLALNLHTIVITFTKSNQNPSNNERDVGIVHVMGFAIYEVVSILGTLAVSGKECSGSMVDCYLHDWTILIVSFSFLVGRLAYLPVVVEVGRTRLIELYFPTVSEKNFKYFNIGFMAVATLFSIMSPYLSIALLLNIVGALVCYLFIYLIPTKIHYGCLYPKKSNKNEVEMGLTDDMSTQSSSSHCNHE
jgi:hypothetical protein